MKTLIQFLIVRPALAAAALVRRHPMIALLIVLFFLAVAALWQSVLWANKAMAQIRKAVAWFEEEAPVIRKVILFAVFLLVPGSFLLWWMLKAVAWWSNRPVKVETAEPVSNAVIVTPAGAGAEGRFS